MKPSYPLFTTNEAVYPTMFDSVVRFGSPSRQLWTIMYIPANNYIWSGMVARKETSKTISVPRLSTVHVAATKGMRPLHTEHEHQELAMTDKIIYSFIYSTTARPFLGLMLENE